MSLTMDIAKTCRMFCLAAEENPFKPPSDGEDDELLKKLSGIGRKGYTIVGGRSLADISSPEAKDFWTSFVSMCRRLNTDPLQLARVINMESGLIHPGKAKMKTEKSLQKGSTCSCFQWGYLSG